MGVCVAGGNWQAVGQKGALAVCVGSSFVGPSSWWRFQGAPSYRVDDKTRKEMPFSELCKERELGLSRVDSALG